MDKVTIEFHEYHSDGTVVNLIFDEDDNEMNCARFHDLCKRFAYAAGYMPETIEKFFGETKYEEML